MCSLPLCSSMSQQTPDRTPETGDGRLPGKVQVHRLSPMPPSRASASFNWQRQPFVFFFNSPRTVSSPYPHPWQGYQHPQDAQVSQKVVACFQMTHLHPAVCSKQLRVAYNAKYNVMEMVIFYGVGEWLLNCGS